MTSRTRSRVTRTQATPRPTDRHRTTIAVIAGLAIVAIAIALATQQRDSLATGQAPAFTLPTSDGGSVSLGDLRGHPVLLYFSEGVGCDSCFAQLADIESSSSAFGDLNVQVVPIMVNEAADVVPTAADFGLSTPIALDITKAVSEDYGVLGTGMHAGLPGHSFVLVDATGTIRWEQSYPSMYVPSTELAQLVADHLD